MAVKHTISFGVGTTVWVAPASVTTVSADGAGAGGSGGGGAGGSTTNNKLASGGGGGGCAQREKVDIPNIVPGTAYEVVVPPAATGGAFGAAGAPGATGGNGAAGGDTIFRIQGGATLWTWRGGEGGDGGPLSTDPGIKMFAMGGSPGGSSPRRRQATTFEVTGIFGAASGVQLPREMIPGSGGYGMTNHSQTSLNQRHGCPSAGFVGGTANVNGADNGASRGGGGGGGGGGGPRGNGGSGGRGGDADLANAPTVGGAAAAGSGAGGGGGGGGGSHATTPTDGGAGGASGSGFLDLTYWV